MARVPRVSCNDKCSGCPALPLTREQYESLLKQVFSSSKQEDRNLARRFLNMEVLAVFCLKEQEVCLFNVGEKK